MGQDRIRVPGSLKRSWRTEGVIWNTERSEEDWNCGICREGGVLKEMKILEV